MTKNKICIAVKEKLVKDSGVANISVYDHIVEKLQTKPRAKGMFLLVFLLPKDLYTIIKRKEFITSGVYPQKGYTKCSFFDFKFFEEKMTTL